MMNYFLFARIMDLVHIMRQQPRTGKGGPGDLAWVWPLAVMLMLPMICCKKKK